MALGVAVLRIDDQVLSAKHRDAQERWDELEETQGSSYISGNRWWQALLPTHGGGDRKACSGDELGLAGGGEGVEPPVKLIGSPELRWMRKERG